LVLLDAILGPSFAVRLADPAPGDGVTRTATVPGAEAQAR
jgi:hypothetical protein